MLEWRFVVPGKGVSFRSPKAVLYKADVVRAAKLVLPQVPYEQPVELLLDYFHTIPRRFDMDNLTKCVMDALTGVAYKDDRFARLGSATAHNLTQIVRLPGGPVDLVKPLRDYTDYLFVRLRVPRRESVQPRSTAE